MKILRILPLLAAFIAVFAGQALADPECNYNPQNSADMKMTMPFAAPLKRGINLTHWWEDETDRKVSSYDILRIKNMGFDFVRVPLSPSWLEIKDPAQQKEKLRQLRCDIVAILDEGIPVILDLRGSPAYQLTLSQHPEQVIQRIEQLWQSLLPVTKGLPAWMLYLGLYDEPQIESSSWWRLQEKILGDLRPVFPDSTFVLSPGPMSAPALYAGRRPYEDKNVLYDFHFYEPLFFTRHGAEWLADGDPNKDASPIVYPVDPDFAFDMKDPNVQKYVTQNWNRDTVSAIVKTMGAWRDHYNTKVACLEFGAYPAHIDPKSRLNWTYDVRSELENVYISWAFWEYKGPAGLVDSKGQTDNDTLKALIAGQ